MPDREKVISNLNVVHEYLRHFENTAKMGEWVADALALMKEQEQMYYTLEHDWRMCRELLKEQEAVTIKKTKEHGFGVYGGICPKCKNWIQSAHSFCGFCGQAVKWE